MRNEKRHGIAALALGWSALAMTTAQAEVRLAGIFGDGMVLQADMPVPVWGTAAPEEKVVVRFAGQEVAATADTDGRWRMTLPPMTSGTAGELTAAGTNEVACRNVVVGEVWICSGQSNMEWNVANSNDAANELAAANTSLIRRFNVPNTVSSKPETTVSGSWEICSPETVGGFTAVGYFFAREIHRTTGAPVGLIQSDWGGTPAQAWTPLATLRDNPELAHYADSLAQDFPTEQAADLAARQAAYDQAVANSRVSDPGNEAYAKGWADPATDIAEWETMVVPGAWEQHGLPIEGAVWFRREVEIPAAWAGRELMLFLGAIDDFDVTYFNNVQVGTIGAETPNHWSTPRQYRIPGSLTKAGRAVIAVRVFDNFGAGGFTGKPDDLRLASAAPNQGEPIALAGDWRYRIEHRIEPVKLPPRPQSQSWMPTGLYNAMIHPLIPYAIRGVIWYQGESNAGNAVEYRTLFPAMITAWRQAWGQGDFPFLFVQLANFMARAPRPVTTPWALLREAQTMTLALPNTGMAVAIDIGDADNIHPRNKQDVGLRLALPARAMVYGEKDLAYAGPTYEAMTVQDGRIHLSFKHLGDGLTARDGELKGFAIAGEDRQFVWAEATIEGDQVVVSSDAVPAPVAVRYAWGNNPEATLYNRAGLPAVPFRTDTWE
jgi:sialate O-acetylesterase